MADTVHGQMPETAAAPSAKRLSGVAWGLFFIWIGIAFLADLGWGAGLLGIGVITLGAEGARKYLGLPVERFWIVVGVVFLAWGGMELLNIQLRAASIPGGAIPIISIAVGVVLITLAFLRKQ